MLDEWLAILEATAFARALRDSVWVYPLVNAGHVIGVALLVGGILPLDLRLLGLWRTVPLPPLWRILTRTAGSGLVLAIAFGALLFSARATDYAASGLFQTKMLVVGAATANVLAFRLLAGKQTLPPTTDPLPARLRLSAAISLTAWLTALVLGRLVGYS